MSYSKKEKWIISKKSSTTLETEKSKDQNNIEPIKPPNECKCDSIVDSFFITLEDKELFRRKERCYGSCSGSGEIENPSLSIQSNNIKMLLITLTILKLKSEDLSSAPEDGRLSILEKAMKMHPVLFDTF